VTDNVVRAIEHRVLMSREVYEQNKVTSDLVHAAIAAACTPEEN
jgi:hypothetical protein